MVTALRVITGAIGIWMVAIALGWMLSPADLAVQFGISLSGIQGMSTGRGDLGGMFLAAGILCLLGIRQHSSAAGFLYAFAILMGTVALGRTIGFVVDGLDLLTVVPFLVEIGFIAVACLLAQKQASGRDTKAE